RNPFEPGVFEIRAPGKTEARGEVAVVGVVGLVAVLELVERRNFACQRAGLEEIARAGDSPDIIDVDEGVAVVARIEGTLDLPAQAVVERQVRAEAPRILREESDFLLPRTFKGIAEIDVLAGALNQAGVGVDGRDAPGQNRV